MSCKDRYRYKHQYSEKQKKIFNNEPKTEQKEYVKESLQNNQLSYETLTSRIKTVEELIKDRNIDLTKYELASFQVTQWEQNSVEAGVVPLYRVYASFKPIVKKPVEMAIERFVDRLNAGSIESVDTPNTNLKDPACLIVSIFDHHFGKFAWGVETGHADYDLKIAKQLYVNAVKDLLKKSSGMYVEKTVLVIGQDFLNINNEAMTTEHFTPQDCDSRLGKIIEVAIESVHLAIAEILKTSPLHIIFVPGNHDRLLTRLLCGILEAYYKDDKRITFDIGHTQRKYFKYGVTGIQMTHGNEEKKDRLPLIFAGEAKQLWADTKFHEIHTGHLHTKKSYQYNSGDSIVGVTLRVLGSLSSVDAWHARKGFCNTPRIAEGFLYSFENGPIGEFIYNAEI